MPALNQVVGDQIMVSAIAGTQGATQLFGQVAYDRKVWLCAPAPGVFFSHGPLTRTSAGFALPANQPVQLDLPAKCELYAITAAGTIQVSRYSATVMSTVGEALVQLIAALAQRLGIR